MIQTILRPTRCPKIDCLNLLYGSEWSAVLVKTRVSADSAVHAIMRFSEFATGDCSLLFVFGLAIRGLVHDEFVSGID